MLDYLIEKLPYILGCVIFIGTILYITVRIESRVSSSEYFSGEVNQ